MQRLPLGIQSFPEIRNEGYLYVDKTEVIHQLIMSGKPFFLGRPRRFGKSLLVSTMAEIFRGNKPLFEGLAIYDKWDWGRKFPVIHLDWSGFDLTNVDTMRASVNAHLLKIAVEYGVEIPSETPRVSDLIKALHAKYKEQVVFLSDEYDRPFQNAISDDNEELFAEIRKYLRTFHEPLKSCDPYLRFLFLTGIARYVGVSIFSTLNNVTDISLDPRYAAICGYTQAELEHSFSTHIETLATANNELKEQVISRIKTWYNGYSWDGETSVYNPYSTLRFFNIGKFKNFWFETGTPSYLINLLQKKKNLALVLGATPSFTLDTVTEKLSQVDEKILLFQTGYLTIKRIELMGDIEKYTLDFPNAEVRESFTKYFLSGYGNYSIDDTVILHKKLAEQLLANDVTALNETLCSALAWIPYGLIVENEHYYHSLMLLWLRLLGFDIQAEDPTNFGRMDAVWELPEQIIVAEIKYAKPPQPIKKRGRPKKTDANIIIPTTKPAVLDKLLAEAFAQITEKRYPEKFKTATTENGTPKKLTALAIACSGRDVKCAIKEIQARTF